MNKLILSTFVFLLCLAGLALAVPDSLKIAIEPEDVLEMEVIKRPLITYVADSKGKLVTDLAGGTWNCKVSIVSGPGVLLGTTSTVFVNGTATFPNLFFTQAGPGYVIQFEVTFPTTANMAVNTTIFDVGARPLGIKLQKNPEAGRPGNRNFAVRGIIWDEALNQAADEEVLTGLSWSCDLLPAEKTITLEGDTVCEVTPGTGAIVFEAVKIPELGPNQAFRVDCFSPEYFAKPVISVQSDPFSVYDFPETALLRKTDAVISFEGPYDMVEAAIVAFNSIGLYGEATCLGCPPGVLPKPKEAEMKALPAPLTDWDPCTAPIFLNQDLSCQVDSGHI